MAKHKCERQTAVISYGPLFRYLEAHRGIGEVHFAGSIRREERFVDDIEIIASLSGRVSIDRMWDEFVNDQGVTYIEYGDFERKITMGHTVEIKFFRPEEMGAALLHSTGGHEFTVAMRALAKKKNLLLNQYGLWTRDKRKLIASKTEHDIFKALNVRYVSPQNRDNTGAIWEEYRRA